MFLQKIFCHWYFLVFDIDIPNESHYFHQEQQAKKHKLRAIRREEEKLRSEQKVAEARANQAKLARQADLQRLADSKLAHNRESKFNDLIKGLAGNIIKANRDARVNHWTTKTTNRLQTQIAPTSCD